MPVTTTIMPLDTEGHLFRAKSEINNAPPFVQILFLLYLKIGNVKQRKAEKCFPVEQFLSFKLTFKKDV